jgi:hypothetical protein
VTSVPTAGVEGADGAAPGTEPLYVAVGTPLGPILKADGSPMGHPDAAWGRVGQQFVEFDLSSFRVWTRALEPVTLDALRAVADREDDVLKLVEGGFIVPLGRGSEVDDAFLDVIPVALTIGLGSDPENPNDLRIADARGNELARLCFVDYIVWSYLNGRSTVRQAAEHAEMHLAMQPGSIRPRLMQLFSALVRIRAVALDRA